MNSKSLEAGALENKGLVYLKQRDWQSALENTETVKSLYPTKTWNLLVRAIAADKLGRKEDAQEAHADWLARHSDDDVADMRFFLPAELRLYLTSLP